MRTRLVLMAGWVVVIPSLIQVWGGAYKISGGSSGGWILGTGASFALVAIVSLLGGVAGWALIGLLSVLVLSFRSYVLGIADLLIMYEQGRLSDDELERFTGFHSVVNIVANSLSVFSVAGKVSTASEQSISLQLAVYDFMVSMVAESLSWWRR